jgi:NADPH-dependent curcumin reductase
MTDENVQVRLASRPVGRPAAGNFTFTREPLPEPRDVQVLIRTRCLSLDPYMRGRMSDAPSYAPPVEVGGVMVGGHGRRRATGDGGAPGVSRPRSD